MRTLRNRKFAKRAGRQVLERLTRLGTGLSSSFPGQPAYTQAMSYPNRSLIYAAFALLLASGVQAQTLQAPSDFLGYELGTRFTPHHRVVDYYEHIAEQSSRVTVHTYGETYEGRPLLVAFVGTPERLQNLDETRLANLSLTGLEGAGARIRDKVDSRGAPGALSGADSDTSKPQPAIVWLNYNVHGNEAVSTEASMATIYELVRPGNTRTASWLENTLVIIDPCVNPDGRDRYVSGYNQRVGTVANPDPVAREHSEPWPGGRTNHYHFDLNRDWAWQTQTESQARLELFNAWLPQVVVDFHEQGVNSPYYFAPAAEPLHDAITDWQRVFQDSVGTNHAKYFDAEGWLYFTREVFDLFYPGYGDTYPIFNGAIGMTYEQGGGGRAGLAIETAERDTLTLRDRMAHHYTTGLSTVEVASRNASRLLAEYETFYRDALTSPAGRWRTYVMKASSGAERIRAMAAHLDRLGIEYGTVTSATRAFSGLDYRSGTTVEGRAEPGDLVVSAYQPKGVLARVLLEPNAPLPDSLTYDITAWALPYAYGMDAIATSERVDAPGEPGSPGTAVMQANGGSEDVRPYGWALRWNSPNAVTFLARVLARGVNGRIADEPFVAEGSRYKAGTVLFTQAGNESVGDALGPILAETSTLQGIELTSIQSGRVESGSDFGSRRVRFVTAPRVIVATGTNISSGSAGEVWHWFEQELNYPVTMVEASSLAGVDLTDYDVLILPGGSYGSILKSELLDEIRSWVRKGGRLIAMGRAITTLEGKEGFSIVRRKAEEEKDGDEDGDLLKRYADRAREGLTDAVSGAVFRTRVDASHPLGFGMDRGFYTLRRTSMEYEYLKKGWNVGVLESAGLLAGHVGIDAREKVEEVLAFGVQEMGRGSVVYVVDDPIFRGFWYDGQLLLGNAVFMLGR
jgi:zinc carboxypeptidase